ncbi:hypothetical protein BOTBODRAFT_302343 [Botryobasidium botryosum FD-172 SS1]|uniref:FAD-binding PCMH-type domain-containing protein n=1 Tax=Botryobasidium botryosum (strain FD-172 SS1) TaxID=930990 RepID=A0A067MK54_BOTB1|nr:hypothetical protein BOTBODRAFT_302343 [Botryobasidium botryosum FD-172 SS1]
MKAYGFAPLFSTFFVLLFLTGADATPISRCDGISSCLSGADVTVVGPTDSNYSSASQAFNERLEFQPVAIVYPSTADAVSQIVTCASSQGLSVNARSGGHSYAAYGLGGGDGHLVIDLSNLKSISLDADSGNVASQTGNRLGDLATSIWDQGQRALPHGTCPYVGTGGHTSFGGFGPFSRVGGLLLDRVVSADVVLANGTAVTASASQYSDLFWALRGAGASYGIVTSWTFSTLPAPQNNIFWQITFSDSLSQSDLTSALVALQTFVSSSLPDEFWPQAVLGADGNGGISLSFSGTFFGDDSDFQNVIAPFVSALPQGNQLTSSSYDWIGVLEQLNGGNGLSTSQPDTPDTFFAKSLITTTALPQSTWASWSDFLFSSATNTDLNWFVEIDLYGGAISRIGKDDTAFAHRDAIFTFQLYASSQNSQPPYPDDGIAFVDNMLASIDPNPQAACTCYHTVYSGRRCQRSSFQSDANYVDPTLTPEQWQTQYYDGHYQRLTQIKQIYDPNNIFSFPQSIGLTV